MRPVRCTGPFALLSLIATIAVACTSGGVAGEFDFARMVDQKRLDAYEASDRFADGKAMRSPPAHAVIHEDPWMPPVIRTGRHDGRPVARSPLGYSRPELERGQDRFGIYCAPCHGFDGLAVTPIAGVMTLRKPPALVEPRIVALPDGQLFTVISQGYGLMPSYANQLPVADRWAVVAYVRALELSQGLELDRLPSEQRRRILDKLGGAGAAPDTASARGPIETRP